MLTNYKVSFADYYWLVVHDYMVKELGYGDKDLFIPFSWYTSTTTM